MLNPGLGAAPAMNSGSTARRNLILSARLYAEAGYLAKPYAAMSQVG